MTEDALVQTSIDVEVKERAEAVLEDMGLTVSDAVRIMLTKTADDGAPPFDLSVDADAHDRSFRASVQGALEGLESGENEIISEAEWDEYSRKTLDDMRRRLAEPNG